MAKMAASLRVAHEEDSVRSEPERSGRFDLRVALLQARGRVARPGGDVATIEDHRGHDGERVQFLGILESPWLRVELTGASAPYEWK